ncbi:hypothetical protein MGG_13021 [Pyricularia oryzae 70-15]|uniref:Uncharacterized protein n=1 Tax=Pyricularia oryzae (strain 70-15 / ATCC MYA-4617 / FGSC 8958) TaxID=242507 RepID=G4MKV8_PYRO7|nr:uncharacterized protein MGG_13021 [Pyricularia oryzae 70-15]EHA57593.1 hypothetical protein MGG_13021 [Pyricularia oryzae 70-15]
MDFMSKAAGMGKTTAMCTTLLQAIDRYIVGTKTASVAVCEFHSTIRTLDYSIVEISKLLHQRGPEVLPFERKHHEHIQNIVNSCTCTLESLETKLHDGQRQQDEEAALETGGIDFDLALESSTIRQLTSLIKSYNNVLQLSMITLSLTVTWAAEGSQGEIRKMVRQLADSMPQLRLKRPGVQPNSPFLIDMNDGMTKVNISIPHEVRAWRLSAEKVAAAVSLYEPDQMSQFGFDSAIQYSNDGLREISPSDSGVDLVFDEEPKKSPSAKAPESRYGNCGYACPHLLQARFEQDQKAVAHLVSYGLFVEASRFQRKCIDYKMSLANLGEVPTPRAELAGMQEDLAEILLKTGTRDGEIEAIEIIRGLLADDDREPTEALDQHRRCRLYHRLGSIYMLSSPSKHDQSERLKLARNFLTLAFDGRREMYPIPRDLVLESGDLLVRVMHLERDFESARGYMEWIRQELRPDLSTPISYKQQRKRLRRQAQSSVEAVAEDFQADEEDSQELVNACMWSQSKGFDIDAVDFDFASCSASRGTSPLHMAVLEEKLGIIGPMLTCASSLEHRDSNHMTPLLLACHTRNHKVVHILLESEACFIDADGSVVSDYRGKSALHLCQDKKGGVRVAKLLVQHAQRLVCSLQPKELTTTAGSRADVQLLQAVEHAGKSALSLAVENGNEEMVQFLLEAGACPNLLDNHGKTALYVACERGDERIVRQLLLPKNGSADPNAPGPGQCTPLMAALENGPSIAVKMALARMLLKAGADPSRADGDGRTALTVAKQSSFSSQLVRMMQRQRLW